MIKRELQAVPTIDIGGRWVPTNFLRRTSSDPEAELAKMRELATDLGPGEGILIYPEGTRHTDAKLARVKEKLRESGSEVLPWAERLQNLLPPRLGGPLALLEETEGIDVVFCAHVGFDGFETGQRHLVRRARRQDDQGRLLAGARGGDPVRPRGPDEVALRELAADGRLGGREPRTWRRSTDVGSPRCEGG